MTYVFLSHANEDREIVEKIYNALDNLHEVNLWASFRDIPPGAKWDSSVQNALNEASHIILVVSSSSINSEYVRAEIEYALNENKIVIPVLIDEVKLPPRWHTLQYVDVRVSSPEKGRQLLENLAILLPKKPVAHLEDCLKKDCDFNKLIELISTNSQWLSPSRKNTMFGKFDRSNPYWQYWQAFIGEGTENNLSSILDAKLLYVFFLSHLECPFQVSGNPTKELEKTKKHMVTLAETRPSSIFGKFYILGGQRHHYLDKANIYRQEFMSSWQQNYQIPIEIVSYTRLLNMARQGISLITY